MKALTKNNLKALISDRDNITAMKALFQAITFEKMVKELVEAKQRETIAFYKFKVSPENLERREMPEYISEPNRMFLVSEEDWKIYDAEMQKIYFSEGFPFKPSKAGNCPLLEAEHFVRKLKWEIADLFAPYLGFGSNEITGSLSAWKQYWEIMLSMFAPIVKKHL
jgi:hypothetical protein